MLCKKKRIVVVASNAELLDAHYYSRLWLAVRNLNIPRRRWLETIANAFLLDDCYVVYPSGELYPIPLVDDVFGDDDMRWISLFAQSDDTGEEPKRHSRKLERLRLIDLFFRIAYPQIAAHFRR